MAAPETIEKSLPTNVDAERFVLGSILLDDSLYIQAAGTLEAGRLQPGEAPPHLPAHGRTAGARREDRPHHRRQRADEVQRAGSLRRPELPGFAGRRPAADPQPRQLHPHRQGQGRAAAHHLRLAAHDEPLPAGRGRARTRSWPAPKRRCSSSAKRGSSPGSRTPARSSRITKAASAPSSTPASASRASAPASPSSTK